MLHQLGRKTKLTPQIVTSIMHSYMQLMYNSGMTETPRAGQRAVIVKALMVEFNEGYETINKILRRQAWRHVPVPETWIPFV